MKIKVLSAVGLSLMLFSFALADSTAVYNSKVPTTGTPPKAATCPMGSGMAMDHPMKMGGTKACSETMKTQMCMSHCGM